MRNVPCNPSRNTQVLTETCAALCPSALVQSQHPSGTLYENVLGRLSTNQIVVFDSLMSARHFADPMFCLADHLFSHVSSQAAQGRLDTTGATSVPVRQFQSPLT